MHVVDEGFHCSIVGEISSFRSVSLVSAESRFGFWLFSSGLSNRNAEDPVTVDLLSEESLPKARVRALSSVT